MWQEMLFQGWSGIWRTVIVGVLAYAGLILFLRVSGKRTLTKLNAFDLVVTVALGSTLATILLSSDVALAEGLTAFAVLIALQFIVTWTSVRLAFVRRMVRSEPSLLVSNGEFLRDAMRRARVTEDEIRSAIRSAGVDGPEAVTAVVLEADGELSVVSWSPDFRSGEAGPS